MIELMCKVAAIGVLSTVLSGLLRKQTPEISVLLVLCAGIGMFSLLSDGLMAVLDCLEELARMAQMDDKLLQPIVKTVAISILSKIAIEVCKSGGESGLAVFVEVCAMVLELCVTMPLIRAVAALMGEILG